MTIQTMNRARRTKAESRLLRADATSIRRAARDARHIGRAVSWQVAEQRERRARASSALGTWPYWAPATPELFSVLVVAERTPA